ncbi:hypothetical protein O6H91_23G036600 [Diphasiastrum complanatum]|uniref:Uncharacterized protein n=1 Tax=Diphasiastrum complanatum TaxID=34168 RepID=A0ACC2A9U5_DIPCM|nr:hypothetical protein O6H91_23G036600 [Diphasiastrum complanatum]
MESVQATSSCSLVRHHFFPLLIGQQESRSGRNGIWRSSSSSSRRCSPVAATESGKGGTRSFGSKKIKVLQEGDKSAILRDKVTEEKTNVKLLSRIEQLKLLSRAERAGLLSAAERAGLSLSTIERLGLLSKAEESGFLSAATDPSTPGTLLTLALGSLITGPIVVYFVPENSALEIGLQIIIAIVAVLAGSAAFAASKFLSTLQRSNQ